jgi:APA family basic amino acid/polyamine antiporter
VPLLRRKQPSAAAFVLPGGPLVPIAAAAASVWLLTGVTRAQAIAGAIALAAGLLLYFLRVVTSPQRTPPVRSL